MDVDEVPQEGNATLAGGRKAVYARDADGRMVIVPCPGWEVEEIVTMQAVEAHRLLADAALAKAKLGLASPLEYWMNEKRMDVCVLAQSAEVWQWRVRRHLAPKVFATLSQHYLTKYADALGMTVDELKRLP